MATRMLPRWTVRVNGRQRPVPCRMKGRGGQVNSLPSSAVPHNAVVGLAQQFGHPSGLLGALVGRGMARGNAEHVRWVVHQAAAHHGDAVGRIAELGPGPGVGLEALLAQFPDAQVWGVDVSSVMLSQSRKRNQAAVAAGRLTLLEGGVPALSASAPADLVMANHVVYFWRDPAAEMAQVRGFLRPGGLLALGYQLKQNMPAMAQRRFPPAGHRLYEADEEVTSAGGRRRLRVRDAPRQGFGRGARGPRHAGHCLTTRSGVTA